MHTHRVATRTWCLCAEHDDEAGRVNNFLTEFDSQKKKSLHFQHFFVRCHAAAEAAVGGVVTKLLDIASIRHLYLSH